MEVNNEREQEPHGGRGKSLQEEKSGDIITPLGRSYQGGEERGVVDPTMISLVLRFESLEV